MTSITDKIQKLLRLATNNPNEAEAQAAALKCCQLMAEHQAVVTVPSEQPIPQQAFQDQGLSFDQFAAQFREHARQNPYRGAAPHTVEWWMKR